MIIVHYYCSLVVGGVAYVAVDFDVLSNNWTDPYTPLRGADLNSGLPAWGCYFLEKKIDS